MSFTKLHASILNSSVWGLDDSIRIVWVTLLAMADANGEVKTSLSGLAHQARKTVEEAQHAVAVLSGPDPDSSRADHSGRRIEKIDGGWRLLNHAFYRELGMSESQREYWRLQKLNQRMSKTVPDNPRQQRTPASASAPSLGDVEHYAAEIGLPSPEAGRFCDFYTSNGWRVGRNPMKDWRATLRNWKRNVDERKGGKTNATANRNAGTFNSGKAAAYANAAR